MKKFFKILFVLMVLILLAGASLYVFNKYFNYMNEEEKLLYEYDNIMIVAHPDDDLIWGGSHLLDDDYLVVCITCGSDDTRVEEFKNVMEATGDRYIMLNYIDKSNGKRDSWNNVVKPLREDLRKILTKKQWKTIVTHNEAGEYGHIHHKLTHKIVKGIYNDENIESELYFFGNYYTKDEIGLVSPNMTPISNDNLTLKTDIMYKYYVSQSKVADKHIHMFQYEEWQKYEK